MGGWVVWDAPRPCPQWGRVVKRSPGQGFQNDCSVALVIVRYTVKVKLAGSSGALFLSAFLVAIGPLGKKEGDWHSYVACLLRGHPILFPSALQITDH